VRVLAAHVGTGRAGFEIRLVGLREFLVVTAIVVELHAST
jgi:hypothetical protein